MNPVTPRRRVVRSAAILAATLALSWPALWNRLALLFPDSIEYLALGSWVGRRLLGRPVPRELYEVHRSVFYTIAVWLLHRGALWPLVFAQSLLTAWLLWLVVRTLVRARPVAMYLAAVTLLSTLCSIAWYTSYVMADIYAPLTALTLFLIIFALDTLHPWERIAVCLAACFSITAHASNFPLATTLLLALATLRLLRWPGLQQRGRTFLVAAGVLLLAVFAQLTVNGRLFRKLALFPESPPFLMARLLGDGPARLYLQLHCPTQNWILCHYADRLPIDDGAFLWAPQGIWQTASPEVQQHLRQEQLPLALATLRAYPLHQTRISLHNFLDLLFTVGPSGFVSDPDLTQPMLNLVSHGIGSRYVLTRQAHNEMPEAFFRRIQTPIIALSAIIVLLLLPLTWKRRQHRLLGLAIIVLVALPTNAFLGGVISTYAIRYQDRIDWLLPLTAGLMLLHTLSMRRNRGTQPPSP